MDVRAIPYRYLSLIRSKGAYWDTILELLNLVRKSGKYYRLVELMHMRRHGDVIGEGLRVETSIGNGVTLEEDPVGRGFGERSNHFRHCR